MTAADAMVAALIAAGQDRSLAVRFGSLDGAMLTVIAGRVPGGDGMAISVDLREFAPGDAGRILDDSDVAECYPASRGERKPSAGWVELYGNYYLAAGDVSARANPSGWWCVYRGRWTPAEWQRTSHRVIREGKTEPGIGAAMSGAEDALLAIAAEIVGAVGRRDALFDAIERDDGCPGSHPYRVNLPKSFLQPSLLSPVQGATAVAPWIHFLPVREWRCSRCGGIDARWLSLRALIALTREAAHQAPQDRTSPYRR